MECEPTSINASTVAVNLSTGTFSFAVNSSRKLRRMQARPFSNASRYKYAAHGQHLAEGKAEVEPNSVADDFCRKTVAIVEVCIHAHILPYPTLQLTCQYHLYLALTEPKTLPSHVLILYHEGCVP